MLAAQHWSWSVRKAAADAATAISGRSVKPRSPICRSRSHTRDPEGQWSCWIDSGGVKLEPIERDALSEVAADGETRIILVNHDEFGRSISIVQGGERRTLREGWRVNPIRAIALADGYVIVEGTRFGSNSGALTRVSHGPSGAWQADSVLELAGPPIAFGVTPASILLLLTDDASQPIACLDVAPGRSRPRPVYLLRIGSDGSVESLPGSPPSTGSGTLIP